MADPLYDIQLRLSAIVSSSDDAIISKDLNGTITSWNAGAERMFGYSAEETIGRSIRLIIPSDRHKEEDEVLRKIRAGEGVEHYETVRRAKDGRPVDISLTVSPIKGTDGAVIGASKIARDVTRTKLLERDVRHFAAIVASSEDAIISKTLDGTVVTWNAAAEKLFGYTASEIVGRSGLAGAFPRDPRDDGCHRHFRRLRPGCSGETSSQSSECADRGPRHASHGWLCTHRSSQEFTGCWHSRDPGSGVDGVCPVGRSRSSLSEVGSRCTCRSPSSPRN
jgi:PAS domain S-box-containing protein